MYKPVKIHRLSPNQERKLRKGERVIVKNGSDQELYLSPQQCKHFNRATVKGCGLTIQLDPYQQDQLTGDGIVDFTRNVMKNVKSMGRKKAKKETLEDEVVGEVVDSMHGEGFRDIKWKKIGQKIVNTAKDLKLGKRIGNAVIERAIKTIAGSGTVRPRGRPRKGGALMPAGY